MASYYVPLQFIKISPDTAICSTRIIGIQSMVAFQARETIKVERRNKTLINGAGREATKSAIYLDNGSVVASPYSVSRILKLIANSTVTASGINGKKGKHISVLDVKVEEEDDLEMEADRLLEEEITKMEEEFNEQEFYDESDDIPEEEYEEQ